MDRPFDLTAIGAGLTASSMLGRLGELLAEPAAACVVQAPPGSGKTTVVPPVVANATGGRVLVTQPRRVAVRAAARRLAHLDTTEPGDRVGWSVRGERRTSPETRVEFLTPGLLVRRLLADPELRGVGAVVLDEVHERDLDTDLLLGMLLDVRDLRDDLRLVAMSATLDPGRFAGLLGGEQPAPVVDSPAALHPLQVEWAPAAGPRTDERGVSREFLAHVARTTATVARRDPEHDTLVFLPGAREVATVVEQVGALLPGHDVLALHGRIPPEEQDRAVAGRTPDAPARVVVSTALAESSLTVPGVRTVVDAGLSREPRRDAARGMSGLVTVAVSRASAEQRAGRAARLGPGRVVRCYDERTLAAAPAHTAPALLTSDLTGAALNLAVWGTPRGTGLRLPDPPPAAALDAAETALRGVGALDPDGRASALGQELALLPVEPRWGAALLRAPGSAEVVAAATGDHRPAGADLPGLLAALRRGDHPGARRWREETRRLARHTPDGPAATVGEVVATAWPERIAHRVDEDQYLLAHGTRAGLARDSALHGEEWLAVADLGRAAGRDAAGTGAVIRAAAPLRAEQARELAGGLLTEVDVAHWEGGRIRGRRVLALGAVELRSTPVRLDPAHGSEAVARGLRREGLGLLRFSDTADALRRRLAFLHHHVGHPWPAVDDGALLERVEVWLAPELGRLAAGTPVERIDLVEPLRRLLPWPEAAEMERLAPDRLPVPSGRTAAVRYPDPGQDGPPVVEVKLQECFGLAESPRVAGVPVLFHLLSPAGRPLAVTADLASFWSGPYRQVRAEMRGRYPKHPWPEDPWTAVATSATNRRLRDR